jgi:hypothetical protein
MRANFLDFWVGLMREDEIAKFFQLVIKMVIGFIVLTLHFFVTIVHYLLINPLFCSHRSSTSFAIKIMDLQQRF